MWLLTQAAYGALFFVSLVIAHGDDMPKDMDMNVHATSSTASPAASVSQGTQPTSPTSYFAYGQHSGTILAHIALMILARCFILPVVLAARVSRSHRTSLPGLQCPWSFFGIIYNGQTPDLYENNIHHKIGWIVTCVISVQILLALVFMYDGRGQSRKLQSRNFDHASFLPVATNEHECHSPTSAIHEPWARGESEAIEPSSSIRSFFSPFYESQAEKDDLEKPEELHSPSTGRLGWIYSHIRAVDRLLSKSLAGIASNRIGIILNGAYNVVDRIILPFGFITIATGAVTYGGIFRGKEVFNGLAHFIKGGIFFWYGVLTLGRFIGAWADLGWAWNKKPPAYIVGWKAKAPSGEFVESFVIWLYGATNVFLEHLSGWGKEWTMADMEHVAISIMFFGGGLVGMLFESRRIRNALNSTLLQRPDYETDDENWLPPRSQGVPLNPMPALIILLLGRMMGSHQQDSMTSTMVHKQWGNMLVGFAVARGMTYFLLFLCPPTSYLPTRPPTEIVAGFCLMSGGLILMLSTRQVIEAMEFYELDAMFTLTVGMGFTAFIMSLIVMAMAIKAWAVKSERAQNQSRLSR